MSATEILIAFVLSLAAVSAVAGMWRWLTEPEKLPGARVQIERAL